MACTITRRILFISNSDRMSEKRRVLNRIMLFLLPVLLVVVSLFVMPLDKKQGYSFMQDNCLGKSNWIYNRLFESDENIDIAFIGTSHIIDAVDEDVAADFMNRRGVKREIANLGYCRIGRNMDYAIIKDLFKQKDPQYIVLEVRERENRDGHMDFAYMADSRDVLAPVMLFNDNYFTDVYNGIIVRLEILKDNLLGKSKEGRGVVQYARKPDSTIADSGQLDEIKRERVGKWEYNKGFGRWFYNLYSFKYIDNICSLAADNNCTVTFLYLPGYGSIPQPEEMEFYMARGRVLLSPEDIYGNPANWKDQDHMNAFGSAVLSAWLAAEIIRDKERN